MRMLKVDSAKCKEKMMPFGYKKCEKLEKVRKISRYVFEDFRGFYHETFNSLMFEEMDVNINFLQDTTSVSKKNVLRGYHGDNETWKLFSCLHGSVLFSVICFDELSPDYLRVASYELTGTEGLSILLPPKYGNAHYVISNNAVFHYKQSTLYSGPQKQFTIRWNDPKIENVFKNINPILSERDKNAELL